MKLKTYVIAEIGVNHNGNLNIARELIDAATDAGADAVKFQTYQTNLLVTRTASKATYQIAATGKSESQYEMLSSLQLSYEQHHTLMMYCQEREVEFLSSPFDIESIDSLIEMGVSKIKIPSGELTNLPYLRHIGSLGKPIIMSTGMATLNEVRSAMDVLESAGAMRAKITLLHCSTEYPASISGVNLKAMITLKDTFNVQVGYSDHTIGSEVSLAAVAMGASVIEKHLTLDCRSYGPDHKASMEPNDFKLMINAIRNVEMAFGSGEKKPNSTEMNNSNIVRKSLFANDAIKKGELFTEDNIISKRPANGISPMEWDNVIGQVAKKYFHKDDLIEL